MGEKGLKTSISSIWGCGVCCKMSLWCRFRWRWNHSFRVLSLSSPFFFFLGSFFVVTVIGFAFFRLMISPFRNPNLDSFGCRPDSEGSWSIGVFYGKSPFSLSPIELENRKDDSSSAWPVANPVFTCASVMDAGYPSNFVADPFLYIQGYNLYMFFETKNSITMQGDIGVARSVDQGVTWEYLGIALDEEWHLSYPYVFNYHGQIYMMPEGSERGDLRLYRATEFPLLWTLEKVLINRPLIDTSLIQYEGYHWLFTSDFSRFGTKDNAELEIWYSNSPLGPWKQHKRNPIHKSNRSLGARNAGRPFIYEGFLYRMGQDCGDTYGRRVRVFKVETLTTEDYKEVPVPLGIEELNKGCNAWNGFRYHHLDAQQLPSGDWIAVMDGDRVPSGDLTHRVLVGCMVVLLLVTLITVVGFLVGALNCIVPPIWSMTSSRRNDSSWFRARPLYNSKIRRSLSCLIRCCSAVRARLSPSRCSGMLVLCLLCVTGAVLVCVAVQFLFGGNGAEEAFAFKGHYSQFTMLTMTYEARLWNLKLYVKHYSRCASVREIVVVWNKGTPPNLEDFDSAVPVRVRVEEHNSLNNRFKVDPLIKTRAVLELDDDILMTCNDLERAFRVWREHPERIVGFYPRLLEGSPLEYRDERYARKRKSYNAILTGAAFMDSEFAFKRYWSEEAREGRAIVDHYFNCEDVLMNFLFANASSSRTVEYIHPAWAIDTSKLSGAAISRNTQMHYRIRTNCLSKFSAIYGPLSPQKWEFAGREDGWDV
ncbi:glucosamine inositolphosphorylceramide transferase 1-like [Magnolia sinica]|uniref:glucosamine inositolphosphorylceramide transferase 1-like n=1 Tax=Magnolia sinica TaxID=86752 RepID=UPI00265B2AF7|nr:glucosamine inositolphosphorylceramide transferase 1-like [Magnolia sinica]